MKSDPQSTNQLWAPWGCWGKGPITSIDESKDKLLAWRSGAILSSQGELRGIWGRWWPYQANLLEVHLLQKWRRIPDDHCWVHYTFPKGSPGFLSLRFIHAGHKTRLATINSGLQGLDEIAKLWGVYAIVCTASNQRLSTSLMKRWGFERHAHSLPGLHYIKRFRASL